MPAERTVVIVGRSAELDLALEALSDLHVSIRVIPTVREAERALLGPRPPQVGAILVGLEAEAAGALHLIRALRDRSTLTRVPIAVWARAGSHHLLADAYRAGANSGVLLGEANEAAVRLAQMIHYWAAANEPSFLESPA